MSDPQETTDRHGLDVRPFRGVRYAREVIPDLNWVTSPPYDLLDTADVLALEGDDPHNVVRLTVPREANCDGGVGKYEHAAVTLRRWLADGVLIEDRSPAFYVYEQRRADRVQRGVLAAVALASSGAVLPHEDVMPGPVSDRLALMAATAAQLEPILLLHSAADASSVGRAHPATAPPHPAVADDGARIEAVIERAIQHDPLVDVTVDSADHRLWRVAEVDAPELVSAMRARRALIADGHHRFAAYRGLQRRMHDAGYGPGPWDYGLALLVDPQRYPLELAAIHRCVTGLALTKAVEALRADPHGFDVTDVDPATVLGVIEEQPPPTTLALVAPGSGAALVHVEPDTAAAWVARTSPDHSAAYLGLTTAFLHHVLLPELWRVDESAVTYHHTAEDAVLAAEETRGLAVLLSPVAVGTVEAVAHAGEMMPRKSTSFGPKPRSGLLMRLLS